MFKTKDSVTALLFLAALTLCFLLVILSFLPEGRATHLRPVPPSVATKTIVQNPHSGQALRSGRVLPQAPPDIMMALKADIAGAEKDLSQRLDENHFFIELFGGAQKFATRRVVEDIADPTSTVTKLSGGALTFTSAALGDTAAHAHNVRRLQTVLEGRDAELLYIQAPQKIQGDGTAQLPYGVSDTGNQVADALLSALEENGVDTLDLRPVFEADGKPWEDYFFKTDHHWTPEAAFLAYGAICDRMETYSYEIVTKTKGTRYLPYVVPELYRDKANFSKTTFHDYFLGSQGKRTGTLYGGTDDITMWEPTFMTRFTAQSTAGGFDRTGIFSDTLLFQERVEEKDFYNGNPYTLYSGGDYPLVRITNHYNPDGPRVMLLRDSFACAITPFLALACSELDTIDLRYFNDDFLHYVRWLKPDLVLMMYSPGSARLDTMFDFFDPAQTSLRPNLKTLPDAITPYVTKAFSVKKDELSVNSLAKWN